MNKREPFVVGARKHNSVKYLQRSTMTDSTTARVWLVASGDLRISANQMCWPAQKQMEEALTSAFQSLGVKVERAHPYDEHSKHGFIWNQRQGLDVFRGIPKDEPVVCAEAVWQYSYHLLGGLRTHDGPILTVANWSGEWPGLVGLLNLNASLTKMGKAYASIWSKDFTDDFFVNGLREWLQSGTITHDLSHVRPLPPVGGDAAKAAHEIASEIRERKYIMGILDEGCMGMYNAIFDDELLNAMGIYKERLSQSALLAEMSNVTDVEAKEAMDWVVNAGLSFSFGENGATDLTPDQVLEQMKMYIAAGRMYDNYGCDLIGIQYQQGLKDMAVASDLAEGLLNNAVRPPIFRKGTCEAINDGKPIVHFNEVDEGAGLDALITNLVWSKLSLDPATTLHDVRYGEEFNGKFVWVFMISGAVPPSHNIGGYAGSSCERQPPMYFPKGGGSLKGVAKPGEIVWSRIYIDNGAVHADIGRGTVVELPEEETLRRLKATTEQWPIMHAVLHGVSRDQLMAKHKANHVQVAYGSDASSADRALQVKAAVFAELGITVHVCGNVTI